MSIQPQAIDHAFHTLYYGGQDEQKRIAFIQRWGGFSDETFAQALVSGTTEEKTLAIFALARSDRSHVDELLHTCLKSNEPMERWASALVLGERRDERVLPVAEHPESQHIWHSYQDELVYALGRLEAFGVLTNLAVSEERQRLWIVLLACGSLQARQRYGDLLTQIQINEQLKREIAQVLEQRFGLSPDKQAQYIDGSVDAYFERLS